MANKNKNGYAIGNKINDFSKNTDIIGEDDAGTMYAPNTEQPGVNGNTLIFAKPGSGQRDAFTIDRIIQGITRGISLIVTDPTGNICNETEEYAEENGYEVCILDLKAAELDTSDGFNAMELIKNDEDKARILADNIIQSTNSNSEMGYWDKNEALLLESLMLYLIKLKGDHASLCDVYSFLMESSANDIDDCFASLAESDPGYNAANIYMRNDSSTKAQLVNGLAIRLQALNMYSVRDILSGEYMYNIDLTGPLQRKCIYYVITDPEMLTNHSFIAPLFFTSLFMAQAEYADSLSLSKEKSMHHVHFIINDPRTIRGANLDSLTESLVQRWKKKIRFTIISCYVDPLKSVIPEKLLRKSISTVIAQGTDDMQRKEIAKCCGVTEADLLSLKDDWIYAKTSGCKPLKLHAKLQSILPDEFLKESQEDKGRQNITEMYSRKNHKCIAALIAIAAFVAVVLAHMRKNRDKD